MKNLKTQFAVLVLSTLCLLASAYGQITPSQDSYTNTADPTTNYGAGLLLDVDGATQVTYIQFDLASIPASASVSQATLKLYVNAVTTAGSFNVDYVTGTWSEGTITSSLAPALGTTIVSSVAITAADKNQYILINVTPAVQAWLDGDKANNGLALVANSTSNASFDSKENTTTSHPAELDIVFAGGGTLTGVTTASGSGLTGGGTSGTLNLKVPAAGITNAMLADSKVTLNANAAGGLTTPGAMTLGSTSTIGLKPCTANQVLQYIGSVWTCANAGTGTVTSVASGLGLTGGPISGSGTLAINPAVVPQLAAANTFTGNQKVTGNVTASGTATVAAVISNGTVNVDYLAANKGTELPGVQFGNSSTGEAIASNRSSTGTNPFGLTFYTDYNPRVSVLQSGLVGIGTQAPVYKFEVYAAGATKAQMAMVSTGTDAAISLNNTASGGREYLIDSGSGSAGVGAGNFAIWDNTAEAARLVVSSGGLVGIGTTAPNGQLDIVGPSKNDVSALNASAGDNSAASFTNSSADATLVAENTTSAFNQLVFWAEGTFFGGLCTIDVNGNLGCNGSVSGVVNVDGARKVALYSMQSPENWFEDAGSGQLSNGAARIELDPTFAQTVNAGVEYHVFLTPNGDSKGLYVSQKSATSFEVHEQGGGTSSIAFDYRIMAKRVGYEKVRLADLTEQFNKQEAERQKMRRPVHPSAAPQTGPKMQVLPVRPH